MSENDIFCNSSNFTMKILDAKLKLYKKIHVFLEFFCDKQALRFEDFRSG